MNLHKSLILLGTLGLVALGGVGIYPALADDSNNYNYRNQQQDNNQRYNNDYRQNNDQRYNNNRQQQIRWEIRY
jgi:hypothetical protein